MALISGGAWPARCQWPCAIRRPGALPGGLAGPAVLACRSGPAAWSGGQHPGGALAGQAPAGEVAQVQRGGAALEPGMILGGTAVAELEAASPPGGDLEDGTFHVGPVGHVVLAQPGGGPVTAGSAQQVITLVQDELAAGLAGRAPLAQRAVRAQRAEGGDAGPAQRHGVSGGAGDRAPLFADGEVIDGEPALHWGPQGLGLDRRLVPGLIDRIPQVTGAVGRVAVPGEIAARGLAVIGLACAGRALPAISAVHAAAGSGIACACLGGQE